jgi:hypothetical protein
MPLVARACPSFARSPLTMSTELSKSRDDGGTSSAGSCSGMSLPFSPTTTRKSRKRGSYFVHTAVDKCHRDMELSQVKLATVISISQRPIYLVKSMTQYNIK